VRRERPYGGRWGEDGEGGRNDTGTDDLPTDWPSGTYADYDAATVTVRSPEDDDLGVVRAAIADTREKRYLGLSDATSLPENAGMLFVFSEPRDSLRFVMREMDFGIDIIYADAEGTITRIHNAPEPGPNEDGSEQRYPARVSTCSKSRISGPTATGSRSAIRLRSICDSDYGESRRKPRASAGMNPTVNDTTHRR